MASQCIPSLRGDTREAFEHQKDTHTSQHALKVHKGGIILRVHVMKWAVTRRCWPPSAITFQHKNTTVWERGVPFKHLAECLHTVTTARTGREPPTFSSSAISQSPCPTSELRTVQCRVQTIKKSGTCYTSNLQCCLTALWPELLVTPDSIKA